MGETNGWTVFSALESGALFEQSDGRCGIKTQGGAAVYCSASNTGRAANKRCTVGVVFQLPQSEQVREIHLEDLHTVSTFNPTVDERTPEFVRLIAGKPVAEAVGLLNQALTAAYHEHKLRQESVRLVSSSLQNIVSFFDEQLDVQALLAEVAKAHEQDRPCIGGEPQMIDRLAHVVRTYRGMETRDGAAQIGVAPIVHPGVHPSKAGYAAAAREHELAGHDLNASVDRTISLMSIDTWFRNEGVPLPEQARPAMMAFARWAVRTAAADGIATRNRHITELEQTNTAAQKTITRLAEDADRLTRELAQTRQYDAERDGKLDKVTRALGDVQAVLDECGANGATMAERVRNALESKYGGDIGRELVDVRAILSAAGIETGSQPTTFAANRLTVLYTKARDDLSVIRQILTTAGFAPGKRSLTGVTTDVVRAHAQVLKDAAKFASDLAEIRMVLDEKSSKEGTLVELVRNALFELRTEITSVVERAEMAERKLDEAATIIKLIRFALNEAGYIVGKTPIAGMVQGIINEAANVRRILRESGQLDISPEEDDVLTIVERLACAPKRQSDAEKERADSLAAAVREIANTLGDVHKHLDAIGVEQLNGKIETRMQAVTHLIDSKDATVTALYQSIRSAVGPVDVTNADREAVTEEDAANGPDAREYYAERHALLRKVQENAGGVKNLSELRDRQVAVRNQYELELSEIRNILSMATYHVDTHAELMDVIRSLVGDDAPETVQEEQVESIIWPPFSSRETRVSIPLLGKLAEMIGQPHEDAPPDMTMRQNRIIRMARAVQVMAASHGITSTACPVVDEASFD